MVQKNISFSVLPALQTSSLNQLREIAWAFEVKTQFAISQQIP